MSSPPTRLLALAVFLCLCNAQSLAADRLLGSPTSNHDLLFFPDANGIHVIDGPEVDEDVFIGVNVLYSYNAPQLRALVEYAISNEENEVERLQVGWAFSDELLIWAGRVHNPDNYWNTTFHHGQYLQTSISRPWISRFEDEGGPILAHTTGLLLDHQNQNAGGSGWNAHIAVGVGAHLEDDLEPFDLFSPSPDHGFAAHGRLSYLPDFLGQNQVGLVAGYDEIEVVKSSSAPSFPVSSIQQYNLGAYADWQWGRTRMISDLRYVHNKLDIPPRRNEHFISFYAYLEHKLGDAWTAYGRADLVDNEESYIYLELLQEAISEQWVAGIRWDFARRHALTLELQDEHFAEPHDNRTSIQLQWSAVLP